METLVKAIENLLKIKINVNANSSLERWFDCNGFKIIYRPLDNFFVIKSKRDYPPVVITNAKVVYEIIRINNETN